MDYERISLETIAKIPQVKASLHEAGIEKPLHESDRVILKELFREELNESDQV
jgi:hypothetical protein